MSDSEKVGVLGLGIIGAAWAKHLNDDGVLAATWNRTPQPSFAKWRATPAEVADAASVLIIVVADPPAVQSVLDAVLPKLGARHLVIQCSTIDPKSSSNFAAQVRARGSAYVEAPFTGSKPAAEQRKTVFFLGGDAADIARAEPVLARISITRNIIGNNEQAAVMKLCGNLQISAQMEALCEALAWARRAGISDEVFFNGFRPTAVWSPLYNLKEMKLRNGDYAPQFSVKHMLKDMKLADGSNPLELPIPKLLIERLGLAAANGWTDEDMSALLKNL